MVELCFCIFLLGFCCLAFWIKVFPWSIFNLRISWYACWQTALKSYTFCAQILLEKNQQMNTIYALRCFMSCMNIPKIRKGSCYSYPLLKYYTVMYYFLSEPSRLASTKIRPQFSHTMIFLCKRISDWRWGGIELKQPPHASLSTATTAKPLR